mmetsp:Transcript_23178/g.59100  ORF Transcript_23178/g.59100 Transcript_23178/m.59100 type:complete len:92 (+) Transcript_23178:217-492(+)
MSHAPADGLDPWLGSKVERCDSRGSPCNGVKERDKKGVRHFRSQASNTACAKLATADLRPETKARIREVYADDIRLLGFGEEDASEGLVAT